MWFSFLEDEDFDLEIRLDKKLFQSFSILGFEKKKRKLTVQILAYSAAVISSYEKYIYVLIFFQIYSVNCKLS